ncbi:hypothetical protein LCGC14_1972690, partial [marine sediment metagenome]
MKRLLTLAVAAALASTFGCEPLPDEQRAHSRVNEWLVRQYQDDAVKNAVIAQHTLYPYHFVPNAAVLNALGEHDFDILTAHFRKYPGQVNLQRGDTPGTLYGKRVKSIVDLLKKAGLGKKGIKVANALPGGDGIAS